MNFTKVVSTAGLIRDLSCFVLCCSGVVGVVGFVGVGVVGVVGVGVVGVVVVLVLLFWCWRCWRCKVDQCGLGVLC